MLLSSSSHVCVLALTSSLTSSAACSVVCVSRRSSGASGGRSPSSKIPALSHSSGSHPSAHCSDTSHSFPRLSSSSSKCPSGPPPSSSAQLSRQRALTCPLSSSSPSDSPPRSPSPSLASFPVSSPCRQSFIPCLNLSRLLSSSSLLALSSSHANAGPAQRQHRLAITSTPQHSYSSSASSSSLPPTSSSSSLLRMVQMSASSPGKKCGESQDGRVGCVTFRAGGKRGTTDD